MMEEDTFDRRTTGTCLKFNALQNRGHFIKRYYQSAIGQNMKFLSRKATYKVDKKSIIIY
jgi:hypothetical protein